MSVDSGTIAGGRVTARTGALQAGLGLSGLTLDELRSACIDLGHTVGHTVGHTELESAVAGVHELDDHQYDVVTRAINDRLVETGLTAMIPQAGEI